MIFMKYQSMWKSNKKLKKQTLTDIAIAAENVSYIYNYMFKKDRISELKTHHLKIWLETIIMTLTKEVSSSYNVYRKKCHVLTLGRKVSFHRQ